MFGRIWIGRVSGVERRRAGVAPRGAPRAAARARGGLTPRHARAHLQPLPGAPPPLRAQSAQSAPAPRSARAHSAADPAVLLQETCYQTTQPARGLCSTI
ncbi:unnamed protein product, partial [Brenthis ino]